MCVCVCFRFVFNQFCLCSLLPISSFLFLNFTLFPHTPLSDCECGGRKMNPYCHAQHFDLPNPSPSSSSKAPLTSSIRASTSASSSKKPSAKSSKLCSHCKARSKNTMLYRCGHITFCEECAKEREKEGGSCPLCATPIEDVVRVYRA